MIELTILTIVTLTVLALMRPGKTPPLDNPLIIERPGKYHMTLAPQLNLAQTLIEDIAKRLVAPDDALQESATLCFEVRDKEVAAHGKDVYQLAVTRRNGMLYFQAISSRAGYAQDRAHDLIEFAKTVLANIPATGEPDEGTNRRIAAATRDAALLRGIAIINL
ncbi:MAG: hypothetical protein EPO42_05565 [Gallionellaceae bacterium]|nr:MAG: hypothetical protein EPO42_05565 [Gallionellaceae bacterium]